MSTNMLNAIEQQLLDDVKIQMAAMFDGKVPTPAGHHKSAPYYRLGDMENGYYVLVSAGVIEYIVRYRAIRITETCQGLRIYLLRVGSSQATVMFANHVAFTLLLPQYHLLVSECQDSYSGMGFWQYSADYAFEHNFHVYFWDKEADVLNELANCGIDNSTQNQQQWRNFRAHQLQFWVISDHAIS